MNFDAAVGTGPFEDTPEGRKQREVFICTFGILAHIVSSDGDLNDKELQLINSIMKNTLKLDKDRRAFATKIFNEARRNEIETSELLTRYKRALVDRPQMYEWLVDVLFRLSLVDEVLAAEEKAVLDQAQAIFELSASTIAKIQKRYVSVSEVEQALSTLGLNADASLNDARITYESLMQKYRVEALIQHSFASELIDIAQKRQAEFSAAYLAIEKVHKK